MSAVPLDVMAPERRTDVPRDLGPVIAFGIRVQKPVIGH